MKKLKYFIYLFILAPLILSGCAPKQNIQILYDDCIKQCDNNNVCLEYENCEPHSTGLGNLTSTRCCKVWSVGSCKNNCIEKYK